MEHEAAFWDDDIPQLEYEGDDRFAPIPPAERNLPSITAKLFTTVRLLPEVPPQEYVMEGLAFGHDGYLYFCNPPMGGIYRIDLNTRETTFWRQLDGNLQPTAIKVHRDGRLFVTCLHPAGGSQVVVFSPDGEVVDRLAVNADHSYDDMVFDADGGFYLSDLSGSIANPTSGVWYVAPGERDPIPIATGMVATNGIALSKDGTRLWVTEYGRHALHWIKVGADHRVPPIAGSRILYYFAGREGPDSLCIDDDDNLYVAMCGQGRFLVFNSLGLPMKQILLPGREEGRLLKCTHPQIRPGTNELYLCTGDIDTGEAAVFVARAYAKAFPGFAYS